MVEQKVLEHEIISLFSILGYYFKENLKNIVDLAQISMQMVRTLVTFLFHNPLTIIVEILSLLTTLQRVYKMQYIRNHCKRAII